MPQWLANIVMMALAVSLTVCVLIIVLILRGIPGLVRYKRRNARKKRARLLDSEFAAASRFIKRDDIIGLRRQLESGLSGNLQDSHGHDLLMWAAVKGSVAIGELLLSHGANPERSSRSGWTAVVAALMNGHCRFAEMLFKSGARLSPTYAGLKIEQFAWGRDAKTVALLSKYSSARRTSERQ